MKILMIEPYYGGSHKAFIDGLSSASSHDWTILTLPPYKWKWRMRHGAVTFADQVAGLVRRGQCWDMIFCSDMLNLAEFIGLAPKAVRDLSSVAYFHENQLTYPVRFESERDYQFVMTNLTTALAATSVWFNSSFHRDSFLDGLGDFLKRMPDYYPVDAVESIRSRSRIYPPGIGSFADRGPRKGGPARILWAARWEHDKNPEDFFEALKIVKDSGAAFELSVIGERFRDEPEVFAWAKEFFAENINRWGYQQSRGEYEQALAEADIFVSTANHEFFGIGAVEAIASGAYPLLPERLAYPELLGSGSVAGAERFFYDGTVKTLAHKLIEFVELTQKDALWEGVTVRARQLVERFCWKNLAGRIDQGLEEIVMDS